MSDARSQPIAVATGGRRGIARADARVLAAAGYEIALVDLLVPEMERTAAEINDAGCQVRMFEADDASHRRAQEVAVVASRRSSGADHRSSTKENHNG